MDPRTVEGSVIEVLLRQAGADKVFSIHGVLYHIVFEINDDFSVEYVYNINGNNEYFLQRVKPYPIQHGKFDNEQQLVDFIKKDIDKFRQAVCSSNFNKFLEVTAKTEELLEKVESLFLAYNVSREMLADLDKGIDRIYEDIDKIASQSDKV